VRRYKSENALSLGSELQKLQIAAADPDLARALQDTQADLRSITRARLVEIRQALEPELIRLSVEGGGIELGILP
jgi:hypothetical protein